MWPLLSLVRRSALLLVLMIPAAAGASTLAGRWLTADHSGVIDIAPCGDSGRLCGRIVGVTGRGPNGSVPRDVQGRSQCGLEIIGPAVPTAPNLWSSRITNPNNGRVYPIELWIDSRNRLHLRGYIGVPLFGATQIWTPYPAATPPDCLLG